MNKKYIAEFELPNYADVSKCHFCPFALIPQNMPTCILWKCSLTGMHKLTRGQDKDTDPEWCCPLSEVTK